MKNKDANHTESFHGASIISAISERRSVRAFLPKKVPPVLLHQILDCARWSPSGVNTQPWKVAVLGDSHRKRIAEAIIEARKAEIPENPDYDYYPKVWTEPYQSRRKACGAALYQALGISHQDKEKRIKQWYKNYTFFDAPAAFIFYIDSALSKGSWIDMGMFLQNIMLAARAYQLETCPQASLAEYPDIIRHHLNISPQNHIVCGMAVGYADWSAPCNQYRTTREEVIHFTTWYD